MKYKASEKLRDIQSEREECIVRRMNEKAAMSAK